MNVILPFVWKSFPFIFTADVVAMVGVYAWKVSKGRRTVRERLGRLALGCRLAKAVPSAGPQQACTAAFANAEGHT